MLEQLTAAETLEAERFHKAESLPEHRADFRAAMQCLVTARSQGVKGVALADFLPDYDAGHDRQDDDEEPQTQEEMSRQMEKLAGLFEAMEKPKGVETVGR